MSSMENTCLLRKHTEMRTAEAKQQQLGCKGQVVPSLRRFKKGLSQSLPDHRKPCREPQPQEKRGFPAFPRSAAFISELCLHSDEKPCNGNTSKALLRPTEGTWSRRYPHARNKQLWFPIQRKKINYFFPHAGPQGQPRAAMTAPRRLPTAQGSPCVIRMKSPAGDELPGLTPCASNTKSSLPVPSGCTCHAVAALYQNPARGHSRDWRVPDAQQTSNFARKA